MSVLLVFAGAGPGVWEPLAAAEPAAAPADDTAAKQEILGSPAWADPIGGLDEWFSVQIIYPKERVPQLKATFRPESTKCRLVNCGASSLTCCRS